MVLRERMRVAKSGSQQIRSAPSCILESMQADEKSRGVSYHKASNEIVRERTARTRCYYIPERALQKQKAPLGGELHGHQNLLHQS